jgi:hypothetical protein
LLRGAAASSTSDDRFSAAVGPPSKLSRKKLARLQVIHIAAATERNSSGSKRLCPAPQIPSIEATEDAVLQALLGAGATGLEPATSGVTGLFHEDDDWRRLTRNRSLDAGLRASDT